MNRTALAAAALALCAVTGNAAAADRTELVTTMMTAAGHAIAAQGNAALVQIRKELKQSALASIKPYLPAPQKDAQPRKQDETPSAQR